MAVVIELPKEKVVTTKIALPDFFKVGEYYYRIISPSRIAYLYPSSCGFGACAPDAYSADEFEGAEEVSATEWNEAIERAIEQHAVRMRKELMVATEEKPQE